MKLSFLTRQKHLISAFFFIVAMALAGRGLFAAIAGKKLLRGHDATAYAIFLNEFNENIRHGILFPVWAPNLRFGYGEPHLQFRAPLHSYLAEAAYRLTGHSFVALNLVSLLALLCAWVGMFLLLRKRAFEKSWVAPAAATAYLLTPYLLQNIYVRGAYSELLSFALFPFLALTAWRLAERPGARTLALFALAYGALAIAHPPMLVLGTVFLLGFAILFRKRFVSPRRSLAALALGAAASAFFWLPFLLEGKHVKLQLLAVDFESYAGHFVGLAQFFAAPGPTGSVSRFLGVATLTGLALTVFAKKNTLSRAFLVASLLCLYFMTSFSQLWYETAPLLQMMSFPWRFLAPLTFFGALLFAEVLQALKIPRVALAALGALTLWQGFYFSRFDFDSVAAENFTSRRITVSGMGFLKPALTPTMTGFVPKTPSESLSRFMQGRGEVSCTRASPERLECEAMVIQPSKLEMSFLDYAGWTATVDGKLAEHRGTDAKSGTPWLQLPPGKHQIAWQLEDTRTRFYARFISFLAWLVIAGLLFQNQLMKWQPRLPKFSQNLKRSAAPKA